MRRSDKPERTPADLGTDDPTFVYRNEITRLQQKLAASQKQVKVLEDALRPFSDESKAWDFSVSTDTIPQISGYDEIPVDAKFTVADLRRAAALLDRK